jgi:hypothetical protein
MKLLAHTLWGETSSQKILLPSRVVKEKNGHWKSALFQTQIEDLPLKCCILGNDLKNKTSGEAVEKGEFGSAGPLRAPFFWSGLFSEVNFNSAERLGSFTRMLWLTPIFPRLLPS